MCARKRAFWRTGLTQAVRITCCDPGGSRSSRWTAVDHAGSCRSDPSSGPDPSASGLSDSCHLDSDCSCLNSQLVEHPFVGLHSGRGNSHASLEGVLISMEFQSSFQAIADFKTPDIVRMPAVSSKNYTAHLSSCRGWQTSRIPDI